MNHPILRVLLLAVLALALMAPGPCRRVSDDDDTAGDDDTDDGTIEPTEEMKTAIQAVSEALEMNLVSSELAGAAAGEETDGSDRSNCPEITHGEGTVTVDYGEGCIPDSGILFGELSGSMFLTLDIDNLTVAGGFDELTYANFAVDGNMALTYEREPGVGIDLTQVMDMTFTEGPATFAIDEDLALTLRWTYLELDGSIDYDAGWESFFMAADTLRWDYDNLTLTCPLPTGGRINVQWEMFDVTITFYETSAQTGVAHVDAGTLDSDVNICAWWYGF